ncbi:TetR/AcrR family transcriptional regulator [Azohydromonas lata]|uniref:TetR/AcrR family transcriptional regulator n=1 Tax=Azohydromonas lata TaxID=45677 RepID=UPI000A047763|nr:TetR/AcrR family transcriptional regulator [Azohydromonas lata]
MSRSNPSGNAAVQTAAKRPGKSTVAKAPASKSAAGKARPGKAATAKAQVGQPAAGAQVIALPDRGAQQRRRSNRRSEQTIDRILAATENIVLQSGAERISILDVCRAADVSRGTFYRYFASQEELLDAFSRHKRETFHRTLVESVEVFTDPDERFAALVRYLDEYLERGNSRRLLVVAPDYALGFFKRIFHDSVVRFQDVLGIVFDAWEQRLDIKLDRELVCEMLIRYVLSEQLVPSEGGRKALPRRIARLVESLVTGGTSRVRR